MNSHYTYLSLNLCSLAIPIVISFHPKLGLAKHWKQAWLAITLNAVVFIGWDVIFTVRGVWVFNPRYMVGVYLFGLPIEEILFFFCIPYACLFTWFVIRRLAPTKLKFNGHRFITASLAVALALGTFYASDRIYTATTFFATAIVLIFQLVTNPGYMTRFYSFFCIIIIPFLLVNGILTGQWSREPVVSYDPSSILGLRVGTIPIEDFVYCLLMMLLNVGLAERFISRRSRTTSRSGIKTSYS